MRQQYFSIILKSVFFSDTFFEYLLSVLPESVGSHGELWECMCVFLCVCVCLGLEVVAAGRVQKQKNNNPKQL